MGTTDWYVLEDIFMDHVYDPVIKRLAQDVRNVVDLGANTGFSTRLWQQTYPSARIIAVEPDAANVEMWHRNIVSKAEAIEPMLVQACVAGSTRLVALDRSGGSWRFSMQDIDHANGESICAMTLTQILAKCGMEGPIDLLKCDIEGAESEVFANCTAWVNRVQSLVIELHTPYTSNHFLEDLGHAGKRFEVYHRISCNEHSDLLFLEQVG
jgi:FkbM family methyltransferase